MAVDTRTLLAIPPDNWKGYMSSTSSDKLYFSKIALCLALFSFSSSSSTHSPITWSDTFINGSRKFTDCGINAISSPRNFCFNSSVRTSPLYIMVPERFALEGRMPSIACARRLFPDPLEPRTATISPSLISKVKSVITFNSL